MMKKHFLRFLAFFVISSPASAASGTMIKNDNLRSSAVSGSAVVGQASKGATVEVLQRQGGWTQIKHAGKTGWVRILSVRIAAESGTNFFSGLAQMGGSRPDSRRVVAVAGLRGLKVARDRRLNEEELRGAQFNATELARLDQYASSRADAEQFARSANLKHVDVAYIKEARTEAESNPNNVIWGDGHL
jgi:uncharacterized protein YgiM (DUF1202 family)